MIMYFSSAFRFAIIEPGTHKIIGCEYAPLAGVYDQIEKEWAKSGHAHIYEFRLRLEFPLIINAPTTVVGVVSIKPSLLG